MADTTAPAAPKGTKNTSKNSNAKITGQIKKQTVEVIVFSPEITRTPVAKKPEPTKDTKEWAITKYAKKVGDDLAKGIEQTKNAAVDAFMEKTYNPGHVALRIDDTIYNFGRYGDHTMYSGDGILSEDDFTKEVEANLATHSWIYGFTVVIENRDAIQTEIDALWKQGVPKPNSKKPKGRKIGEYDLYSNSCKTFTLSKLQTGGVKLPSYFWSTDYPVQIRDDFMRWNKEDPKRVIKVTSYKPLTDTPAATAATATAAPATGSHYSLKPGENIILPAGILPKITEIANGYFAKTGKNLLITSGIRTPAEQASAMYTKLIQGDNLAIYTNQSAVQDIKNAFHQGQTVGQSPAQIKAAMRDVIQGQVEQGTYISRHLRQTAFDVRSWDKSAEEINAFQDTVKAAGGTVIYEGTPPHFHVQF